MATVEEIKQFFQDVNIVVPDNVLTKCLEICLAYNVGAEDFVDTWFAYTSSHLGGAPPTIDELIKLERKEYAKPNREIIPKKTPVQYNNINDDFESSSTTNSYNSGTPKANRTLNSIKIPETRRLQGTSLNYESADTSSIYSSPVQSKSQSDQYTKRTDSLKVQCSHGPATAKFEREGDCPLTIKIIGEDEKHSLSTDVRYMYEVMGRKARSLNTITEWLGNTILTKYDLELTEGSLKNHTGEMVTYGRIVSDSDGKINAQSVLLEGTHSLHSGHTVKLNLNKLSKYSLFPGQIAVVEGNNTHTGTFIADKIITDAALSLPVEPPSFEGTMQVVIASGPFTLPSNLSYEPLNDILKYVVTNKPHLLILTGPFFEKEHEGIHNGDLTQTFDSFFESLIDSLMSSLEDMDIQVVIVASSKEAHHHPIYPTPPYKIRDNYPNLRFVSDPCMININGLVIGATTADILLNISNFELFQDKNPQGAPDRLGRLVTHILNQQCFYPLYPPVADMHVDHELLEQHGLLECVPHVLILPSSLRHFIKNINGCLVVNPERSTKGYGAGTFARLEIATGNSQSICNRAACQILRV